LPANFSEPVLFDLKQLVSLIALSFLDLHGKAHVGLVHRLILLVLPIVRVASHVHHVLPDAPELFVFGLHVMRCSRLRMS